MSWSTTYKRLSLSIGIHASCIRVRTRIDNIPDICKRKNTNCKPEDNNTLHTQRIHFVVSSKSHNFFFMICTTNEKRKCFRHNVIGIGCVPDKYKENKGKSYEQNT